MVKQRLQCIKHSEIWRLSHLWMWPLNKFCCITGCITDKKEPPLGKWRFKRRYSCFLSRNADWMWNIYIRIGSNNYQLFIFQVSLFEIVVNRLKLLYVVMLNNQMRFPCQKSQMELFAIKINGWKLPAIFAKKLHPCSILDLWQGSKYAYGYSHL